MRASKLLSITKLQNLKAIHNSQLWLFALPHVVINHKTTKFESNSQHELLKTLSQISCYQSQNYKIWKQFTTNNCLFKIHTKLLSITKLQNLKAIHNNRLDYNETHYVVINHKTTKFESNSQRKWQIKPLKRGCYQSQNYKIWKQFTTQKGAFFFRHLLLSITKLQNLKAIHNGIASLTRALYVVINHKTTKFESNSQLITLTKVALKCCYQSQNYKIWKQFTT